MDKETIEERLSLLEEFSEYIPNDRESLSDLNLRITYKQIIRDIRKELGM